MAESRGAVAATLGEHETYEHSRQGQQTYDHKCGKHGIHCGYARMQPWAKADHNLETTDYPPVSFPAHDRISFKAITLLAKFAIHTDHRQSEGGRAWAFELCKYADSAASRPRASTNAGRSTF